MALETMGVLDGDGNPQTIYKINSGRQVAANSQSVAIDSETKTSIDATSTALGAPADAVANTDDGTFSLISLFKRLISYSNTTDTTIQDVLTELQSPASELPKQTLVANNDLTSYVINTTASGDLSIQAGANNQTIRVHSMRLYVNAAANISICDGNSSQSQSTLEIIQFPGAAGLVLDFDSRPYYTVSNNKNLVIKSSSAVALTGRISYVQS
jgi:hypothetical protein